MVDNMVWLCYNKIIFLIGVNNMKTKDMIMIALFTALISAGGFIKISSWFINKMIIMSFLYNGCIHAFFIKFTDRGVGLINQSDKNSIDKKSQEVYNKVCRSAFFRLTHFFYTLSDYINSFYIMLYWIIFK